MQKNYHHQSQPTPPNLKQENVNFSFFLKKKNQQLLFSFCFGLFYITDAHDFLRYPSNHVILSGPCKM
jgi:hypothetical protein